ncbi:MAG: VIT1/CCC1 transporter family protein [Candidatus Nanopelagicales bacterium]|nr:VIT1/CCC1 transporter family protein [Candidatus Nanopelagicales bacterium]MDZ4250779.1 VIT1/CCC1 transporter family protein [Candidatus Nanopelagicales bacterium]
MRDIDRYSQYLAAERSAARLYHALADLAGGERREVLNELAGIEERHAEHWMNLLAERGADVPEDDGSLPRSDQDLLNTARRFSLDAVLPDLEAAEREAQGVYDDEPDALPGMVEDERAHERVLRTLQAEPTSDGGDSGASFAMSPADVRQYLNKAEPWHRTDKSGSLRAAVFGVSDGLVSNTALVMGFAGTGIASGTVLFAGLAGLLAGAFSMAAGEYVSVSSQVDLFQREINIESRELADSPEEERLELELIYRAKGMDRQSARRLSEKIISDPDTALDTLAREELGLDPEGLGSPIRTAASSFAAFAMGAAVPVIPYVFLVGTAALLTAVCLAVIALVIVGSAVGRLSGLGMAKSAARQLLVGSAAAAVTYVVGSLVGMGLG